MALQDELGMDLTVSVNLSPRQFQQKNLVHVVENSLMKSGLPPERLQIEITENMLMSNSEDVLDKLQRMRNSGCEFRSTISVRDSAASRTCCSIRWTG